MNKRRYDFASLGMILLVFGLLAHIWRRLPVFSDTWYHLGVIRAFSESGPTLHAWWEFAPFGRPHLYSPLFHVVNAGLVRVTGIGVVELAKFYDVVTFPALLAAGWAAARCLFGARAAFVTLLLLALNIGLLFPCSLIMMPGTFAVMLWPFVHVLSLRGKWFAAGVLLAVMGYLHFGVAMVAAVSLLLNVRALAVAFVLFSPWLLHLARHREFLHSGTANLPVFIPVFTLLAAAAGAVMWLRNREKEARAVLWMVLASGLFLFTLRERFWTYGGFLFAILGGYGVQRLKWSVPVLLISCASVTPFLRPATMKLALPVPMQTTPGLMGTPLLSLAQWQRAQLPPPVPGDLLELTEWIEKNVGRGEVLLTEDRLLGSALFALTGRRTSSGLWSEVMSEELREKLTQNYLTGSGYIIVSNDEVPGQLVASFGRFTVFHRGGAVQ